MANKFNQYTSSGQGDSTNGSLDLWGYSLRGSNLNSNSAIKTNSIGQLISTNLNISDIENLQNELDSTLQNPYQDLLITDGLRVTTGNVLETDALQKTSGTFIAVKDDLRLDPEISLRTNFIAEGVEGSGVTISDELKCSGDIATSTIPSVNNAIENIESSLSDKMNRTGDTMSGNLDMGGNSIQGVFQMNVNELNERTLGAGIYTNNTLYTTDVVVTGANKIKVDNIEEASIDGGVNVLSNLHMNDKIIDQVTELKCDSIDSKGGMLSVSFPSNLDTPDVICDNLREKTLLGGVTCKANLNMFGKNINNVLGLYIDNIYERTGLLGINIRNDTNFNSKNVSGVSTLSASTVTATFIKASNIQNPTPASAIFVASPITLDTVAISGASQITTTTLDTDAINPISGTDVLVNANLDFQNTYNLLNIDSINNIRPSGGLYSQSNLTQFNQTTETNMLGGTNISGSLTIPANTFKQLSVYAFKSSGTLSGGSNDLFTLRLKSSAGALFAELPVTITDNGLAGNWWDLSADFSVNQLGSAGIAVLVSTVVFRYINNTNTVATRAVSNINNTTFDTTVLNTLEFSFQNDVTNPLTFLQMNASSFTQWY